MQKIIPHLWFDKEAKEAAEFYTSIFPDSKVIDSTILQDIPGGDSEFVRFEIWGQKFMGISAGPLFKFNPSVSFMVNFDPLFFGSSNSEAREKLDYVWSRLLEGGTVLMGLDKYPFSERYGWVQDKYGLSWQLILSDPAGDPRPAIVPSIMYTGGNFKKAEEAINFYLGVFKDSKMGGLYRYGNEHPGQEDAVMYADFMIEDSWIAAMESVNDDFPFNEAVSFLINCENQQEIDYYWNKLSAMPEAEQCGWLKDKYGLSWQVSPVEMEEMLTKGSREQINRVTQAFLPMKKLEIEPLRRAYDEEKKLF